MEKLHKLLVGIGSLLQSIHMIHSLQGILHLSLKLEFQVRTSVRIRQSCRIHFINTVEFLFLTSALGLVGLFLSYLTV